MSAFDTINEYAEPANTLATISGGLDAAAEAATGLPGSRTLGPAGGALSGYGLTNDGFDIAENGLTPENSRSAVTNGTGLASYVSSLLPGTTASVASPLLAAGSAGLTFGAIGDEAAGDYDWTGTDGGSWSDWASDVGADAYEAGGHWAGIPTMIGTSFVGGIDSIATGTASVGESVGRTLTGTNHSLVDGVRDGMGMNLLLRSVAQGVENGRNGS